MEATLVRKYIERLDRLSTIPVVLKRVMDLTSDPASSAHELYDVISHDQSLAERVIRLANSPFFGHPGAVGDIHQAIMLLGYEKIRNISMGMSVFMIPSKKDDRHLKGFWAHSYEVAYVAAVVARISTMVNPGSAFLAGLLHDAGRLVFFNLSGDGGNSIIATDDLLDRERALFGCDHALAGSWLAEKTNLPEELVVAVRYHHQPSGANRFQDMVSVVSLSEALSRRFCPRIEDDGRWIEEHDALLLELAFTNDNIREIEATVREEEKVLEGFLELIA